MLDTHSYLLKFFESHQITRKISVKKMWDLENCDFQ